MLRLRLPVHQRRRDEQGAVAILVALITVPVLFGLGGLVIDIGALYAEKRQLQNGADAAAYAVAANCLRTPTGCNSALATAQSVANSNANDANATINEVCGVNSPGRPPLPTCAPTQCPQTPARALPTGGATYVRVTTSTRTASNGTVMPPLLSQAWNAPGEQICAEATVRWGAPAPARTFPLTFSQCEFDRLVPSGTPGVAGTGTPVTLLMHDPNPSPKPEDPCTPSKNGSNAPGSFGFLEPDNNSTSCQSTPILNGTVNGLVNGLVTTSTGNAVPNNNECQDALHHSKQTAAYPGRLFEATILIPIFNKVTDNGSSAVYTVTGYAAFYVTGWKFGGQYYYPEKPAASPCQPQQSCIAGYFVGYVSLSAPLGSGAGTYGASAAKLAG